MFGENGGVELGAEGVDQAVDSCGYLFGRSRHNISFVLSSPDTKQLSAECL